jgi:DNA polymerase delta subunit 2
MFLFLETENRMEIAKQTLRCMHMSPVCPDTLWCQPYQQIDPFIIQTVPKIYFVGNQPEFQTELFEFQGNQTRIVLVPKFSETGTIVLVHTSSLECKTITFSDFQ